MKKIEYIGLTLELNLLPAGTHGCIAENTDLFPGYFDPQLGDDRYKVPQKGSSAASVGFYRVSKYSFDDLYAQKIGPLYLEQQQVVSMLKRFPEIFSTQKNLGEPACFFAPVVDKNGQPFYLQIEKSAHGLRAYKRSADSPEELTGGSIILALKGMHKA